MKQSWIISLLNALNKWVFKNQSWNLKSISKKLKSISNNGIFQSIQKNKKFFKSVQERFKSMSKWKFFKWVGEKLFKWIREEFESSKLDLKRILGFRFFLLFVVFLLSILIFLLLTFYREIFKVIGLGIWSTEIPMNFRLTVSAIPTLTVLWLYRQIDTQKTLEKSERNLLQSDLFNAQKLAVEDHPASREVGVEQLIRLYGSENKVIQESAESTMIQVLKDPLSRKEGEKTRYTYAQKILKAIREKRDKDYLRKNLVLTGLELSYQNFTEFKGFSGLDLRDSNFGGSILYNCEFSYSGSELIFCNFKDSIFTRCKFNFNYSGLLKYSPVPNDFRGVRFHECDFSGSRISSDYIRFFRSEYELKVFPDDYDEKKPNPEVLFEELFGKFLKYSIYSIYKKKDDTLEFKTMGVLFYKVKFPPRSQLEFALQTEITFQETDGQKRKCLVKEYEIIKWIHEQEEKNDISMYQRRIIFEEEENK